MYDRLTNYINFTTKSTFPKQNGTKVVHFARKFIFDDICNISLDPG